MKIIKYAHSCLLVEESGKKLVIDPGVYSTDLPLPLKGVSAVVVTHFHADHMSEESLKQLQADNPDAPFFAPSQAAESCPSIKFEVIDQDKSVTAGPFSIDMWPCDHVSIHANLPKTENLGIMVNDQLYYPGDSFHVPPKPVETLACPACAPWLEIGEVIDFIGVVKAKRVFPTHDALLSDIGRQIHHPHMQRASDQAGSEFIYLGPGDTL